MYRVTPGGPAEQAGIRPGQELVLIGNEEFVIGGDLIVEVDATPIANPQELGRYVLRKRPGDVIRMTLYRGRRRMTLDVKLGERPDRE